MKNIFYRPSWIEIDLRALEFNLRQIRKIIGPNTKILACVKSDAYGHGLVEVSKRLEKLKIDYLGVSSIDEGIILRKENISLPILILGLFLPQQASLVANYNLTPTISTRDMAYALQLQAKIKNRKVPIHIKIDTGMSRLGIWYKQALDFIENILKLKYLNIEGIYTHLSSADTDYNFTQYQISCFYQILKKLEDRKIYIPLKHIANSSSLISYKTSHLNLVRPGLILYGLYPKLSLRKKIKLKPLLCLKSKIIYLKKISALRPIGYNKTYFSHKPTFIATIPVGYGDGYLRSLSNKAEVLIKGKRFKIVGRISMDHIMVDVKNLKIKVGEIVTLIGKDRKKEISSEEIAEIAGTIPYELVCSLGKKLPRIYIN